jgi:hypothetical protein
MNDELGYSGSFYVFFLQPTLISAISVLICVQNNLWINGHSGKEAYRQQRYHKQYPTQKEENRFFQVQKGINISFSYVARVKSAYVR